jgi:hypothetical protein
MARSVPFGTDFKNPNFAAMAEAVGVRGIRLEDPADVEDGITASFAHNGPVLVDAVVNRTEFAMPPSVTMEMAKGFTLYMVKAVMSCRGDELIDQIYGARTSSPARKPGSQTAFRGHHGGDGDSNAWTADHVIGSEFTGIDQN